MVSKTHILFFFRTASPQTGCAPQIDRHVHRGDDDDDLHYAFRLDDDLHYAFRLDDDGDDARHDVLRDDRYYRHDHRIHPRVH